MHPNQGIYLSLLDSAQSAIPLEHEAGDKVTAIEWWRPQTHREQEQAYALAKADVIARLLYGESIVLPYNQMIDSYAWLRVASEFLTYDLADVVDWPLFKFAYFSSRPPSILNSNLILSVAAEKFAQESFKLSAWGDIDPTIRKQISQEIEETQHGQRSIATPSLHFSDYHQELWKGFQHVIDYFREFEHNRPEEPICYWVPPPAQPLNIWPRFVTVVRKDADLGTVLVGEIQRWFEKEEERYRQGKTPKARARERRSDLYDAIAAITKDSYYRQGLKSYVDYFYNQKVGFSLTRGRGVYVISDNLASTPLAEDIDRDKNASQVVSGTTLGKVALVHIPFQPKALDFLDWDIVHEVLHDGDFKQRASDLKAMLLGLSSSSSNQLQQQEWHRRLEEKVIQHQEWLAKQLGNKVISVKKGIVFKVYQQANIALTAAASGVVAYGISHVFPEHQEATLPVALTLTAWVESLAAETLIRPLIEKTAAGSIMADLKAAVTLPDGADEA